MSIRLIKGDCREILKTLLDESVHCVVTSPPYWGLRDYQVSGQIGLEPTFDQFIAEMVAVFREVRRVLRSDGTLWLNLGDSYATGTSSGRKATTTGEHGYWENPAIAQRINGAADGLKPKDLCGIPWRLAFALQADGWWLRSDIIWSKKNPMPESVTDRPTKSHEYLFLLAKSERYYFDQEAVREGVSSVCGNATDDGVLSEAESQRLRLDLQNVRESKSGRVASQGRASQRSGSKQALRQDGKRESQANGVSTEPQTAGIHGFLSAKPGRKGSGQAGSDLSQWESTTDSLFPDTARQGSDGTETSKTTRSDRDRIDSHSRRMDSDIGASERSMRLLPGSQAVDDGSHNPVEPGRTAHKGQCDPSLSELQRAEERSSAGRNIRSVWHIATAPFAEAHFATFPPELIEPCIKAGCPDKCCPHCGKGWERQTKPIIEAGHTGETKSAYPKGSTANRLALLRQASREQGVEYTGDRETIGFRPTCSCPAHQPVTGTVLDPFGGAGTTGLVADRLQRNAILIELNSSYAEMARRRINGDAPLFAQVEAE